MKACQVGHSSLSEVDLYLTHEVSGDGPTSIFRRLTATTMTYISFLSFKISGVGRDRSLDIQKLA
jgi:hypothetical protein